MKATEAVRGGAGRALAAVLLSVVVAGGLAGARPAHAQSKGDVVVSLVAKKVTVDQNGRETFKAADRAFPGEIVQYDALYRNQGNQQVSNLEPTLPIPAGLEYVADSAKPAPAKASLDGKTFAPVPLMRAVTLADGRVVEQPVPAAEYRALRWSMGELAAGGSVAISARARLSATTVR